MIEYEVGESGLPIVRINEEWGRMLEECEVHFATHERVYQRGGVLVDIGVTKVDESRAFSIRPMPLDIARIRLAECIEFQKFDKRSKAWIRSVPPEPIVKGMVAAGRWPNVRQLDGIREVPFFRRDGSFCSKDGYDHRSRYALASNIRLHLSEEDPTRDEAISAAGDLLDLVSDFHFVRPCHRSAWLAYLLTLIIRPACKGAVPAFGVTANMRGVGKGKLVDIASNIFLGRDAAKQPFPEKEEELKKTLTAIMLSGKALTLFDNVARSVGGASLDNAITATIWEDRELSKSKLVTAPNTTVMTFTGNNIFYSGDTARRIIPIAILTDTDQPEGRVFKHPNILAYVRAERSRYLTAAITILRAYVAEGKPRQGIKHLGSFEDWSNWIPNVIVWLGLDNCLDTRSDIVEVDDSMQGLDGLFECWKKLDPCSLGMTVRAFLENIGSPSRTGDPLAEMAREAICAMMQEDSFYNVSSHAFGMKMRSLNGRVHGNSAFETCGMSATRTQKWRVAPVRQHDESSNAAE